MVTINKMHLDVRIRRRTLLASLAASFASGCSLQAAGLPQAPKGEAHRIAALDWGIAATLVALGIVPIGVPAPAWYARYVVDPSLPSSVVDVGLLFTPNFELLQALAPQLIVATPALQQAAPMLQRIAPVYGNLLFQPSPDVLDIARRGTLALADKIGIRTAGERLIEETHRELSISNAKLSSQRDRAFLLASPLDNRHVSLFGPNSLYGAVLQEIGLTLAEPNIAGEFNIVGLERLGAYGNAEMILLESPVVPGMAARLTENRLWRTFPFVCKGRLHILPATLGSGGLPAASRFLRLLRLALSGDDGRTQ